jgi:hypothetical protein
MAQDRRVDVTSGHSSLPEQRLNGPVAGESEQQMLRLDHGPAEHPRFILGEQDLIVRPIVERAQHQSDRVAGQELN